MDCVEDKRLRVDYTDILIMELLETLYSLNWDFLGILRH